MRAETDPQLRDLLGADSIAVIGCSTTPGKEAHEIPKYMLEQGYEVIPINPYADTIFQKDAYDSLAAVEETIDMVDVFRPSEEVAGIVEEVLARDVDRGDIESLWLQLGIHDDEATAEAVEAGIDVVQDRCLKVEHQRLL
ncbi:CoA-binding protein [Halovenus salina]|uniref:CoA-binding protein n=1 Tax=Halovenus salina TaxID=1510225 RepID=A0ABD5VZP1_9EURY|nr:CoA-binding protein [Halovenus salina]